MENLSTSREELKEYIAEGKESLRTEVKSAARGVIVPDCLSGPIFDKVINQITLFANRYLRSHELFDAVISNCKRNRAELPSHFRDLLKQLEVIYEDDAFWNRGYIGTAIGNDTITPILDNSKKGYSVMNINNTYNIGDNNSNLQFQEGNIDSSMEQGGNNIQGCDFNQCERIISEINKYQIMFPTEFGAEADKATEFLKAANEGLEEKNQSKIKTALLGLKELVKGIGTGIIANWIYGVLKTLPWA